MPEVIEGTPDAGVAPVTVLGGHPDDEPADLVHDPWTPRPATAAAVVLPRNQLSMPAQEGVRRHERLQIPEGLSTEGLGLCGEASTLGVGEPEPARAELFPQDAILLLEIVDHITLLLIDPARDRHDEELEGLGKRRHVGERNRRPSRTSQPGEGPA